jgi:hypothetical protein
MTPEVVKAILASLFEVLYKKFANRPLIMMALHAAEAVIPLVLPLILSGAQAKMGQTQSTQRSTEKDHETQAEDPGEALPPYS